MAAKSKIEWCDRTYNPIIVSGECQDAYGRFFCTPISPGCDHCYASAMNARLFKGVKYGTLGKAYPRLIFDEKIPRFKPGERVFVGSMFDLFHEAVSFELVLQLWDKMRANPQTTFMILTKRPARMKKYLIHLGASNCPPIPNIWLGVSVESQEYVWRIQKLLECDAAVRFVSCEPLLGPIELRPYLQLGYICEYCYERALSENCPDAWQFQFQSYICPQCANFVKRDGGIHKVKGGAYASTPDPRPFKGIDWVIVGGETGPGARPMNIDWARQIIAQCDASMIPIFIKQIHVNGKVSKNMDDWPSDLKRREFPGDK